MSMICKSYSFAMSCMKLKAETCTVLSKCVMPYYVVYMYIYIQVRTTQVNPSTPYQTGKEDGFNSVPSTK